MKFLDLFAGIGGFRLGMEQAGHECVGFVEIDKYARKSYQAIHDTEGEWTANDITTVTDDDVRSLRDRGQIDVICGGFPCQAFSVAGKRGGFDDTRGTLFFEIVRIANIIRPRYLFLENVKGLLNHDKGITFETIIRTMDELGYDAEWEVCNSKNFGVPQNRERLFIIGHLRGSGGRKVFPVRTECEKDYELQGQQIYTTTLTTRYEAIANGSYVIESEQYAQTTIYQRPRGNNKGGTHTIAPTLTSNSYQDNNHLHYQGRIRKLTPKEFFRLQGFPDSAFDKAAEVNSNSQLYKQAGNSVTVNVIYEIAKRLGDD